MAYYYKNNKNNMNSINLTKRMLVVSLITVASLCVAALAQAQIISDPGTDASQDAAVTSSPSNNSNQDGSAGITSSPSSDSNQDGPAVATPAPSAPSTPAPSSSGGGSSGSSGSYGGGSYGGYSSGGSTVIPVSGFCPFVSALMDPGASNDAVQVSKLQAFLKDTEGYDVSVNGSFDEKTEAAVIAFQTKYISDIMGPWGATKASGTVYLTTLKKINQIACSTALNLSAADLSIINAYKQAEVSGASAAGAVGVNQSANNGVAVGPSAPGSASSSDIFSTGNPNVAAAGQASVFSRFWNFLKSLF